MTIKVKDNDGIDEIYLKATILGLEEELEKYKKYYDRDKEELMESCYSLAKENEELKSKVDLQEEEIIILNEKKEELKQKIKDIRKLNTIDYNELQDMYINLREKLGRMQPAYLKFQKEFKKIDRELEQVIMIR